MLDSRLTLLYDTLTSAPRGTIFTPMIDVPSYAKEVLSQLTHFGYRAYVVGGCVRDSLLGREPADWDVCTDATPEEMLAVFRRYHVIKTGLKHGTLTVRAKGHSVEVTTFRTDGAYTDNRHPDAVTFVSRVEDDLARRDFTINAMAYNPELGRVDAFGGQEDLAARTLRCVGEPDLRFQEDGLRILRALRFAARFELSIERETAYAIHRNRHLLANISAERIYKELQGIIAAKGVGDMMLAFPDVFSIIIPQLAPLVGALRDEEDLWLHTTRCVCAAPQEPPALRLALLLHELATPHTGGAAKAAELAEEALRHLKSDNATAKSVTTLVRESETAYPTTRPAMRRLIGRLGKDTLHSLFAMRQAHLRAEGAPTEAARPLRQAQLLADEVLAGPPAYTAADLAITGNDLIAMGMRPGPQLGRVLATLLTEVQDERIANEREALAEQARALCSL